MTRSQWNSWDTQTAIGLVILRQESHRAVDMWKPTAALTSFSRRQSCVATCSGMAEYCAMCSTAEELLHLRTILGHFGFRVNTTLYCDSVAARGIAQRAGLGKVKALAVKTLWLQEVVRERGLQIKSIPSKENKADVGTKALPVARLNTLRGACGIVVPRELSKRTVESETELDPD